MDSMIFDLLTEEQREKFTLIKEDEDLRGVIQRNRIQDQTVFDSMLIDYLIESPQHEAAHEFMDATSRSGMGTRSPSLDPGNATPAYAVAAQMGQRRMAFSVGYRAMVDSAGKDPADLTLFCVNNIYYFDRARGQHQIGKLAKAISKALWALAKCYGISARRDPRRILRAQVGAR